MTMFSYSTMFWKLFWNLLVLAFWTLTPIPNFFEAWICHCSVSRKLYIQKHFSYTKIHFNMYYIKMMGLYTLVPGGGGVEIGSGIRKIFLWWRLLSDIIRRLIFWVPMPEPENFQLKWWSLILAKLEVF